MILLEDDGLIVINKPAGVPTAGDTLEQAGSAQRALMDHYKRMIWAVHQLDRATSGVNLFVRRKRLVAHWTEALKAGRKTYLAACAGRVAWDEREARAPLGWDAARGRRGVDAGGKSARSVFRVLERARDATLLEVTIETGRTHQIRLHLEHLGLTLLGERRYGEAPCARAARHCLHAWRIEAGGRSLEAPPPADMREALSRAGLDLLAPA